MTYKRFTWLIAALTFALFLTNLVLWKLNIETLFEQEKTDKHGGLARLGYINVGSATTGQRQPPIKQHIEFHDYVRGRLADQKVDILTIGDSFFAGYGGYYFQDILSSDYNYNVLNISVMQGYEALEMVAVLLNNGYLDVISPKAIIVESVGRSCVSRYGQKLDFTHNKYHVSREGMERYYKQETIKKSTGAAFLDPRMYEITAKYIFSKIYFLFNTGKLNSRVQFTGLSKPLFSNPDHEKLLLFYSDDLRNIAGVDQQKVNTVNDNFNAMADALAKKNIQLVFMPAVDKYDLYAEFRENKALPGNPLFSYLRQAEKKYIFVDTKKIQQHELVKGEKDIYWLDDTHWSWKGQEAVAKDLVQALLLKNVGPK